MKFGFPQAYAGRPRGSANSRLLGGWNGLEFLGFSRPKRAFSMGYWPLRPLFYFRSAPSRPKPRRASGKPSKPLSLGRMPAWNDHIDVSAFPQQNARSEKVQGRGKSRGCPHCAGRKIIARDRSHGLSRFRWDRLADDSELAEAAVDHQTVAGVIGRQRAHQVYGNPAEIPRISEAAHPGQRDQRADLRPRVRGETAVGSPSSQPQWAATILCATA